MSQSRCASLAETAASIAIGFIVSMAITATVFPLYGIPVTVGHNFQITAIFTIASVIRSYAVRRLFNRLADARESTHD